MSEIEFTVPEHWPDIRLRKADKVKIVSQYEHKGTRYYKIEVQRSVYSEICIVPEWWLAVVVALSDRDFIEKLQHCNYFGGVKWQSS